MIKDKQPILSWPQLNSIRSAFQDQPLVIFQTILVFAIGFSLRFLHLGYSNLQGDEIRIIAKPDYFDSLVEFLGFLLGQKAGPVEHLITFGIGLLDPTYSSELLIRLPFALADSFALICFFLLAWRLFNFNAAIFAGFLYATNGIFVGQARFAQYQSFVHLGVIAGILFLVLSVQKERWKISGLYLGFSAAAVAFLSHFDGFFALPPMGILLIEWWRKRRQESASARTMVHLGGALVLYALLVLPFYIEYASRLETSRLSYWATRFTATPTNTFSFFQYFNPGFVPWLYLVAVLLATTRLRKGMNWQVAFAWLIPPLVFIEFLFNDSRASAYDYFLPITFLAGVGFSVILDWLRGWQLSRFLRFAQSALLGLMLVVSFITYQLMVDHTPEYPWQPKTILGMEAPGGFLEGLFGVPHNRQWRSIATWFEEHTERQTTVTTNEKLAIAHFYLPDNLKFKYIYRDGLEETPDSENVYILFINLPRSQMEQLWGRTSQQWRQQFSAEQTFYNAQGQIVATVFHLSFDQIVAEFR